MNFEEDSHSILVTVKTKQNKTEFIPKLKSDIASLLPNTPVKKTV